LSGERQWKNLYKDIKRDKQDLQIQLNGMEHQYRTHANRQIIEEWEEAQEEMKVDINQLKDQISQILEILKSKGEAITRNVEATSSHLGI